MEEKGENCKASSTLKSLGWVGRVLLDGWKGAAPLHCRRKGVPYAWGTTFGCRGVMLTLIGREGVFPFNWDNLFRGRFGACCLNFLWVGLRFSEVGTTTARPALWFGEAIFLGLERRWYCPYVLTKLGWVQHTRIGHGQSGLMLVGECGSNSVRLMLAASR